MDAMMHRWYPARFPEEIDNADILRILRMNDALEIIAVEDKRIAQINGDIEADALTADEWAMIKAHDLLIESRAQHE